MLALGKNELSLIQFIKLSNYFENIDLTQALELAQLSYDRDEKNAWQYYVDLLKKFGTHESEARTLKVTKDITVQGNITAYLTLAQRYEDQLSWETLKR